MNELKTKKFINKLQNIKVKHEISTADDKYSQIITDATSALLNLGYIQGQINSAINEAIPQEKEMKLENLIKNCIKILST